MINKLYVIGNGFDLHHNIDSSYQSYRTWLRENHPEIDMSTIEEYTGFDERSLWSSIEENLGRFQYGDFAKDIVDGNSLCVMPDHAVCEKHCPVACEIGSPDVEVSEQIEGFTPVCSTYVREWIQRFETPLPFEKLNMISPTNAVFLSFNYTDTLESLYQIPSKQILHIHGFVKDPDRLYFGHGMPLVVARDANEDGLPEEYEDDTYGEVSYNVAIKKAVSVFNEWRKPVNEIIDRNRHFFSLLSQVTEVWFLGFGFSLVDQSYVDEIVKSIQPDATINVSYYNNYDEQKLKVERALKHFSFQLFQM